MPVYQQLGIEKGWKKEANKREGNVLVVKFRPTNTKKKILELEQHLETINNKTVVLEGMNC